MYRGQLSAMADVVEKELEYYRKMADEQKEIIEQLTGTGQPKGYVYVHPYDVAEYFNNMKMSEVALITCRDPKDFSSDMILGGRRVRQSPLIPATSKNFK